MRFILFFAFVCWFVSAFSQKSAVLSQESAALSQEPDTRRKVRLETTEGNIVIALSDSTPIHRDNFLRLVSEGYYDSLLFHRVIPEFMIQAGDPNSRNAAFGAPLGEGSTDYTLPAEIRLPHLYHHRGAVCAAREGDDKNPERRSSGSQFYIVWGRYHTPKQVARARFMVERATKKACTITDSMELDYMERGGTPHLDGQYTVFGEVIEGLKEVVETITWKSTDDRDRPLRDVRILRAVVIE